MSWILGVSRLEILSQADNLGQGNVGGVPLKRGQTLTLGYRKGGVSYSIPESWPP